MTRTRPGDDGFTLIEMLVSTLILALLLGAVFGSIYLYFSSTTETTDRLSESPNLQIVSSYLVADAASSEGYTDCGTVPAGGTRIVSLSWTDPGATTASSDDSTVAVSYVSQLASGSTTQMQLVRYYCKAGSLQSTNPVVTLLSPETTPQLKCSDGTTTTVSTHTWCPAAASSAPASDTTTKLLSISFAVCTADASNPTCKTTALQSQLDGRRRTL